MVTRVQTFRFRNDSMLASSVSLDCKILVVPTQDIKNKITCAYSNDKQEIIHLQSIYLKFMLESIAL